MIGVIAAIDKNNLLGLNGKIPWHSPEDLKHFKEKTTGSVVIMGRLTFNSIGRCLPNRVNIVVSSTLNQEELKGPIVCKSLQDALDLASKAYPEKNIWIIGGAQIYAEAFKLNVVDVIELTRIDQSTYVEDKSTAVYFPKIPDSFQWTVSSFDSKICFERYVKFDCFYIHWEYSNKIEVKITGKLTTPDIGTLVEDSNRVRWIITDKQKELSGEETVTFLFESQKEIVRGIHSPRGMLRVIEKNFKF